MVIGPVVQLLADVKGKANLLLLVVLLLLLWLLFISETRITILAATISGADSKPI